MSSPHNVEIQVMTSDNKSKLTHNFRRENLDCPNAFVLELVQDVDGILLIFSYLRPHI